MDEKCCVTPGCLTGERYSHHLHLYCEPCGRCCDNCNYVEG
jgi:hypothetical protein